MLGCWGVGVLGVALKNSHSNIRRTPEQKHFSSDCTNKKVATASSTSKARTHAGDVDGRLVGTSSGCVCVCCDSTDSGQYLLDPFSYVRSGTGRMVRSARHDCGATKNRTISNLLYYTERYLT